jgi:hypothetical protein
MVVDPSESGTALEDVALVYRLLNQSLHCSRLLNCWTKRYHALRAVARIPQNRVQLIWRMPEWRATTRGNLCQNQRCDKCRS